MIPWFDTHCHLTDDAFAAELPEIVRRAGEAGVRKIVTLGTDLESSQRALALAERLPSVYAAVGWHPSHVAEAPGDFRPALRELARHPKVVAIGETGLDYHWLPSKTNQGGAAEDAENERRQDELLQQHFEVAGELGLSVVIHERDCFEETLAAVAPWAGRVRCVFHCYVNSPANLKRILDLGAIVSFTGVVTFKNANLVRESVAACPAGKFMLETDAPYLAPMPHRGKRCEPAHVALTAAEVARVRGCTLEELGAMTCATAAGFFRGLGEA